jgi:hypothetical protein
MGLLHRMQIPESEKMRVMPCDITKNEDEKYWAPHIPKGAIKYPTEILKKYFFEDFVAEANEERSII